MTTPPRSRTAPSAPASCRPRWRALRRRRLSSAAPRAAASMRAATLPYPPYDRLPFEVPVRAGGRRQRPRLDPHRGDRAEPRPDRADPGRCLRRAVSAGFRRARRGEGMGLVEGFRGDILVWVGIAADGSVGAATCAIRPGSSGRCSRPRSRATSSPTSRSATRASTAPTRARPVMQLLTARGARARHRSPNPRPPSR